MENLTRVGVKLPNDVKEWYAKTASSYGSMAMGQLMAYVLTTYAKQQQRAEVAEQMATYIKSPEMEKLIKMNAQVMSEIDGQVTL